MFKLERFILKYAVAKPSTDEQAQQLAAGSSADEQAQQLAAGSSADFAAWRVEMRAENQLLLGDFLGRTRSWLMVAPLQTAKGPATRLYFGSAVVAKGKTSDGKPVLGFVFQALRGFHKIYSRTLLHAAASRLS